MKADKPFSECLNCHSHVFRWGPRGGAAMNVECWYCEAVYNIAMIPGGPFLIDTIKPGNRNKLRRGDDE